jgi:SpoIID/LytB domain protein
MPIKKISIAFALVVLIFSSFMIFQPTMSSADELDDINKELAKLSDELSKSVAATKPLESELVGIQSKITNIKGRVVNIERDMAVKRKEIDNGYKNLTEKEKIINETIREYYVQSYYNSPLLVFLSIDSASQVTQTLAYQKAKTDQDKATITNIALSIVDLERKKNNLELEQKQLVSLKANLDTQSAKLDGVVKGAKTYQADLSGKISDLSAKQQEIINAKSGSFTVSGNNELADEYAASIQGFRESAPGGSFGVFSFGAYTHRNGMSQYGAKARAEAGQSVEDILKAYYPNATLKKDFAEPGNITVDGTGSISFEDQYLQGIYEMPGSWHVNALKAQAIAARTYAIRYTNNGQKSICTTESCQVFKNEKKGGAWEQAVNDTKGWVLVDGSGSPVSTQFASTHGGFSNTGGWDTTDGAGGSDFISRAYEKLGGSPWLYKSWWRDGYSSSGNTCGRSGPWLSSEEMADIVNTAIALKTPGIDTSRITPLTTSCWGGNPYSREELRKLVEGNGGISSATSVSVSQGNGNTNSVTINGVSIGGNDFKTAFNLRAPGYVRIPQTGFAFFNIEKK